MNIGSSRPSRRRLWRLGGVAVLAALPLAAGCDFEVTNPGPVQDKFLDQPAAYPGIVNGINRAFNDAWNEIGRRGASVVREVFPSGNTGRIGISETERQGLLLWDQNNGIWWTLPQNARWVAEDAIRRFQAVLPAEQFNTSEVVALAYLWAGYANRQLGEHECEAVIDGGEAQPHTVFYQRAEEHFTNAMTIAQKANKADIAMAAQAGRASVRAHLGKWAEAVADAKAIPNTFKFQTKFSDLEEAQYNWMRWAVAATPYRVFTTWNTFYESYYRDTGDPRTPWITDPKFPTGDQPVGQFGKVPFYIQTKFTKLNDPVNVSSGREMRLIEAEALLVQKKWQEAMAVINALRTSVRSTKTGQPLEPWTATNLEEAWTAYKKEHGIELWLEGRRLGARRRWADQNTPGQLTIWELPSETEPVHERGRGTYLVQNLNLCYPMPRNEIETNPNLRGRMPTG